MSSDNGSIEYKVIKRIPLDSVTSKVPSSSEKTSKKLEKINIIPTLKKDFQVPKDFKSVKKVNLKIDFEDVKDKLLIKENNIYKNKKTNVKSKKKFLKNDNDSLKKSLNVKMVKPKNKNKNLPIVKPKSIFEKNFSLVDKKDNNKENVIVKKDNNKENVIVKKNVDNITPVKQIKISQKQIPEIDSSVKKEISFDNSLLETKSSDILKEVLDNVSKPFKEEESKDFYKHYEDKEHDVDDLLDKLNNKTKSLNEDVFMESFSFLDNKPKVEKVKYSSYAGQNLFSKIDEIKDKKERLISPKKKNAINKDLFSNENISLKEKVSSNENTSFNENTSAKEKNTYNQEVDLLEEFEIPIIVPINDDVEDVSHKVDTHYTSLDDHSNNNLSSNKNKTQSIKTLNDDSKLVSVIKTNEQSEKLPNFVLDNNQVKLNSDVEKNFRQSLPMTPEKFNVSNFSLKMDAEDIDAKNVLSSLNLSKKDDEKISEGFKKITNKPDITETTVYNKIKTKPTVKKDLIAERFKDLKDKDVDYILPKDAGKKSVSVKNQVYQEEISSDNKLFSSLVYTDSIIDTSKDIEKVYDKYSIDEFTYVTIYYDKDFGLFYNIIQPELSTEEENEFDKIKKIFFNTIDQNYYSFNGDKHSLDNYIEKIYDLSLDKLSYNLNNLQKKLYLKFIQRDFFGLGILTNLLKDRKILEVSCSGEKSNLTVYHVDYGLLKTNISFSDISELNKFVVVLTKNMGLYINQAHPVINGYLPNGHKVEGLYSIGDTSSKGSSFVIKKYLDEPLTPVSLIETGIGTIDVFSYIWSAIVEDYKVILVDTDDSFLVFNSLLLFLPEKKIITVQAYDRFKLPQKEWISRVFTNNQDLNKKLIIEQTISQKPDYIVVDEFGKDLFNTSWYNLDIFSIVPEISQELIEQLKIVNQKAIFIELRKINHGSKDILQIISIKEINSKKENMVVEIDLERNLYTLNLLASSINIVQYQKHKKLMRWMRDSKVTNFKDFNSIVSEFYFSKEKIFERFDIK